MPESRRRRWPLILRASITLDGKLDPRGPLETSRGTQTDPLDPGQLRALFADGLVDEIHLTVLARVDGRREADTLSGPPNAEFFPRSLALRLLRMEPREDGCLLHYRVRPRGQND